MSLRSARFVLSAAALIAAVVALTPDTANADHYRRGGRRSYSYSYSSYGGCAPSYYAPPVYYAPTPVYYTPAPVYYGGCAPSYGYYSAPRSSFSVGFSYSRGSSHHGYRSHGHHRRGGHRGGW